MQCLQCVLEPKRGGNLGAACDHSFLTDQDGTLLISLSIYNIYMLESFTVQFHNPHCAATVCCPFLFFPSPPPPTSHTPSSPHQNCVKAVSHLVGIRLRSSRVLCIHSPLCVPVYVIFVCAVLETKMLSDIYQRLYSIFYLYLKVDNMKRQANECCDILYVFFRSTYSCLIIVMCGNDDDFTRC